MQELFKAAVERGASDIHIKAGDFMRARIHGVLQPLTQQRLTVEQVKGIALQLIPHEEDKKDFERLLDYDCSWGIPGVGRFRVNIMKQRGSPMIVMRAIPIEIPSVEDLGLPPIINKIAAAERGLILVTGVTGSGKSSTMAAMINWINRNKQLHVVTLENPIEFLHRDNESSITQRDIGTDTDSFATGLRSVLRQDPDVILIGEMRDKITIETALKAAETGHLVISTLHTKNAVQTISRIIAVFEPSEQEMIRVRLSESLQAVVSQRLVQRTEGGRVATVEVMIMTATIRDCVRDQDRMEEIGDLIEEGREHYGSQSFDQHLQELVQSKEVAFEVAKAAANNPADFDLKMNMFGDPRSQQGGSRTGGTQDLADEMTKMMGR
ncbi:MAG: PilT/PilU family type 4a pilus ATPase [Gemmatimonadota bacterium]|nr:PilT/PilU family type 4a pilus ATPase [Gemmatimonadota bacterium]MDH3422682.1 PilT/PilU family type 4a pilus ATPase [Gemmatimonadota bacterium]